MLYDGSDEWSVWRSITAGIAAAHRMRVGYGGPPLRKGESLLAEYMNATMKHLNIELLPDGEGYYISSDALPGVWGQADTVPEAVADFLEGLQGWIALARQRGQAIPEIDGVALDLQAA